MRSRKQKDTRVRAQLSLVQAQHNETVAAFLRRWIRSRRALRESTVMSYEATIENYLIPYLGDIDLFFLVPSDIDAMYGRILNGGTISTSTVTRIHATLMSALNAAVRSGEIERNPAELVELPRAVHVRRDTWTAKQVATFLRRIGHDDLFALYALLAIRGMRRGEALGLKWEDLDLDQGLIRIERQISGNGGSIVVGDPKSRAGIRPVAIDSGLCNVLDQHKLARATQLGRPPRPGDWVFGDASGNPIKPIDATRRFQRLVKTAGLPTIRLHDLRHTSATLGLASGESLLEVSRRLGHSSVAVTADIYSEISPEAARGAAERMASHIWDGPA